MRISLCMIVKDEEYFLDQCLGAAVDHVDEIIVVDTGSSDRTREIAARYTDKVVDFAWTADFASARNVSLEHATGDWILVLDADEVISGPDMELLRDAIALNDADGYFLNRRDYNNNALEGGWIPVAEDNVLARGYRGYHQHPICRVFRNREDIRFEGRVHERVDWSIEKSALLMLLEVVIHHYVDDNPDKDRETRQVSYLAFMERELEQKPDGRLHTVCGTTYLRYKNDYRRAIEHLRKAVELDYSVNSNLECIAEAHYRLGEIEPAYAIYLDLHENGYTTPALCLNLANLSVKREAFPFAVELLERSLELGGFDAELQATIRRNIDFLVEKKLRPAAAAESSP